MSYIFAVRAIEEELYNRLPNNFKILNFCFDDCEALNEENVVNINMNEYGVMNPSYVLIRDYGLERTIQQHIDDNDTLLLYVKDIENFDGFLNITGKNHFLSSFMYKRRYLNYYLYTIPTIFEVSDKKTVFDRYLKELVEYGNIVPIRILRNFLVRSSDSTNRIMIANVTNAVLDIVSGYSVKDLRRVKRINKMQSKVYQKKNF